jgi:hypothetical protein
VTLTGELLALAVALGVPRDTALDALAAGPLAASVNRIKTTSSDFIIALAAKDLTLATDAADLPQLAAARGLAADGGRRGRGGRRPPRRRGVHPPGPPGHRRAASAVATAALACGGPENIAGG